MTCATCGASYGEYRFVPARPGQVHVPLVSHLLVTRPSKSRALECFVVEIAQSSTHIAMMVRFITLFFTL